MIERTIRARLLADSTISPLVGARISPYQSEVGDSLPVIIYMVTRESNFACLGATPALAMVEMDLVVLSEDYGQCKTIADAVQVSVDGFSVTDDWCRLKACRASTLDPSTEAAIDGRQRPTYMARVGVRAYAQALS